MREIERKRERDTEREKQKEHKKNFRQLFTPSNMQKHAMKQFQEFMALCCQRIVCKWMCMCVCGLEFSIEILATQKCKY